MDKYLVFVEFPDYFDQDARDIYTESICAKLKKFGVDAAVIGGPPGMSVSVHPFGDIERFKNANGRIAERITAAIAEKAAESGLDAGIEKEAIPGLVEAAKVRSRAQVHLTTPTLP